MDELTFIGQVGIRVIVTKQFKDDQRAKLEQAQTQLLQERDRLTKLRGQAILQPNVPGNAIAQIDEQLRAVNEERRGINAQLEALAGLEMGQEVAAGVQQALFVGRIGDNVEQRLRETLAVFEDGVLVEIRTEVDVPGLRLATEKDEA